MEREVAVHTRLGANRISTNPPRSIPPPSPPVFVREDLACDVCTGAFLKNDVTWVTMFADLKSHEPTVKRHDVEYYMQHAQTWMSRQTNVNLVAFVEPVWVDRVKGFRSNARFQTRIVPWDMKSEPTFKHVQDITTQWECGNKPTRYSADKDTPLFVWLTMQKFRLCDRVAVANPFRTSHVYWVDFGIGQFGAGLPLADLTAPFTALPGGRVHVNYCGGLDAQVWAQAGDARQWYSTLRQLTPCGLFGGDCASMSALFRAAEHEWVTQSLTTIPALEEAVLARLVLQRRERFNLTFNVYETLMTWPDLARARQSLESMKTWPLEWTRNFLHVFSCFAKTEHDFQLLHKALNEQQAMMPRITQMQQPPLSKSLALLSSTDQRVLKVSVLDSSSLSSVNKTFDLVLAVPTVSETTLRQIKSKTETIVDARFAEKTAVWILQHMTEQDIRHSHIAFVTTSDGLRRIRDALGCYADVANLNMMETHVGVSSDAIARMELHWTRSAGWMCERMMPANIETHQLITPAAARSMKIRAALQPHDVGIDRADSDSRCMFVLRTTEWSKADQLTWTRMQRAFQHTLLWVEPLATHHASVMAATLQSQVDSAHLVTTSATTAALYENQLPDHLSIEPGLAQLVHRLRPDTEFVWVIDGAQWSKSAIVMTRTISSKVDMVATHVASQSAEPGWYWFSQPPLGTNVPPLHQRYKSYLQIFRLSVRAMRSLARPRSWTAHRELFVPTACFQDQLVVGDNLAVRVVSPELEFQPPTIEWMHT